VQRHLSDLVIGDRLMHGLRNAHPLDRERLQHMGCADRLGFGQLDQQQQSAVDPAPWCLNFDDVAVFAAEFNTPGEAMVCRAWVAPICAGRSALMGFGVGFVGAALCARFCVNGKSASLRDAAHAMCVLTVLLKIPRAGLTVRCAAASTLEIQPEMNQIRRVSRIRQGKYAFLSFDEFIIFIN
jgi:hypothetical protein